MIYDGEKIWVLYRAWPFHRKNIQTMGGKWWKCEENREKNKEGNFSHNNFSVLLNLTCMRVLYILLHNKSIKKIIWFSWKKRPWTNTIKKKRIIQQDLFKAIKLFSFQNFPRHSKVVYISPVSFIIIILMHAFPPMTHFFF